MGDIKFFCPRCGQKIVCESGNSGARVSCPTCQEMLTIPSATVEPSVASAKIPPSAVPPILPSAKQPQSKVSPSPRPAKSKSPAGGYSILAVLSLLCSVWVLFGFIPGIIFGHWARARMRRNIFLKGEGMAAAGLVISYVFLSLTLILTVAFALNSHRYQPINVTMASPDALASLQSRVVDEVITGQSSEEEHSMDGMNATTESYRGRTGRAAVGGGSFSYVMKVLPTEPMSLNCEYSGNERRGHEFDIAVDDQIIAVQKLYYNHPGNFFYAEYKIPEDLTRGKTQVKVEFQAHAGQTAGVLYSCQMLKAEP